jgi:hypothetical protein
MEIHKQGEHVFNDIVQTVENTKNEVVAEIRLVYPEATKAIFDRSYRAHIGHLERNPVLVGARQLKALPSGVSNDLNSRTFGVASLSFRNALRDLARSIVRKAGNADSHIGRALLAWKQMTEAGVDQEAYKQLLASKRGADRAAIEHEWRRMKLYQDHDFPLLGRDIVRTIDEDVREYVRSRT